jgi:hypothetical protein
MPMLGSQWLYTTSTTPFNCRVAADVVTHELSEHVRNLRGVGNCCRCAWHAYAIGSGVAVAVHVYYIGQLQGQQHAPGKTLGHTTACQKLC